MSITALIVIDVQESFRQRPNWSAVNHPDIADRVNRLVRASRERTLTRIFTAATGLTPLRYQQLLRLERAEHLIGHGATVEAAARAVGFEDARMLRRLRSRPTVEQAAG